MHLMPHKHLPRQIETHIELLAQSAALWIVGNEYRPEDGAKYVSVERKVIKEVTRIINEVRP